MLQKKKKVNVNKNPSIHVVVFVRYIGSNLVFYYNYKYLCRLLKDVYLNLVVVCCCCCCCYCCWFVVRLSLPLPPKSSPIWLVSMCGGSRHRSRVLNKQTIDMNTKLDTTTVSTTLQRIDKIRERETLE